MNTCCLALIRFGQPRHSLTLFPPETANSPYFEEAVKVMARICCEAECSRNYNSYFQSVRNTIVATYGHLTNGESLASSAVKTSVDVDAKMILVISETGKVCRYNQSVFGSLFMFRCFSLTACQPLLLDTQMANYVSKFNPGRAVMCLTPDQTVARQLSGLVVAMHTIVVDSLQKSDELIDEASYELIQSGMLKKGDIIVVVAGKASSLQEKMEVIALGDGKKYNHIVPNSAGFFFSRDMILAYSEYGSPLKKLSSSDLKEAA